MEEIQALRIPYFLPKREIGLNAVLFYHAGYMCVILRPGLCYGDWHLCGYVVLPAGHPLRTLEDGADSYSYDRRITRLEVHGGVTFYGTLSPDLISDDGRVFAIGFDCNHGFDLSRERMGRFFSETAKYRDIQYVINETKSLAEQVKKWE